MSRLELFLWLVPLLVTSMVLHELAHAVVATRLGDPTPREHGRLTLNPVSHLDPLGTAMFGITYWLSSFMFGWAKPVLVQPGHFRRPKEGMALVAVAGPLTNFAIALACVAVIVHVELSSGAFEVLALLYQVNVILGVFNLLPVPPLDGSRIVAVAMSDATYERWRALDQYGMLAIFALIFLFRRPFFELIETAYTEITEVMVRVVGG
ncbi:MAG TPA: site-2 protease family protein [Gaiellaceae bacterium]|nr:site-2 protease family protein [Gaiellaceae bacterium]